MAKKIELNENQMGLFDKQVEQENIIEVALTNNIVPKVQEDLKEVSNPIKDFLQAKEVTSVEVSGQVKMTRDDFINSVPSEDRFVSISSIDDKFVTVTIIPEDGSLTLKGMKELFPELVTQVQKIKDLEIIDSIDNMALIEKLENIIEGKKIAAIKELDIKKIDSKIDSDIASIGDLNSINIEDEVYEEKVEEKVEQKSKRNTLKV